MSLPKYAEERNKVLVGQLPEDFLRVHDPNQVHDPNHAVPSAGNHYSVQTIHHDQRVAAPQSVNQIVICVAHATLVKNYSLTKMDPYVRLRIGHSVFETHSDVRGGKFPHWNKTIATYLPNGIKTIHLEVFDERTLAPDERIAYADYVLPDEVLQGKFLDTWIPLSGKQGVEKEGQINVTICVRTVPYWSTVAAPMMPVYQPRRERFQLYMPNPNLVYPPQPQQNPNYGVPVHALPQPYRPSEDDIKQVQEMFPDFDREVILSVLENCQGNRDQAVNSLLTLSSDK